MCKMDLGSNFNFAKNIGHNIEANVNWAKDRLGIGAPEDFDADFAKKDGGWAGGGWMDRLGINKGNKMGLTDIGNKLAMARDDFRSSLGEAGLGIPKAYEGGNWMKRFGMENPNFSKDWGGGNWQDRLGLGRGERASVDDMQGIVHELGLSQEAWATNLGGGNWYKKKLGMGQFDKKGGGGGDSEASGTDDTTSTTTTEEKVIEEKMNQLTEDDPQEAARIAATRARRRRALKNKFGKRQTIRTSGRGAKQYA